MKTQKKNLRSIISALIITIATSGFAMAQPGEGQQGPPSLPSDKQIEKMVKKLDKELDLTDEQNTRVSELYIAHFHKVEAKMKSSQRPERNEMEALDTSLEKKVKAVLTEKQQETYTGLLEKQEKNRNGQGQQARPQGGQRPQR